jgi:hypothetical protein
MLEQLRGPIDQKKRNRIKWLTSSTFRQTGKPPQTAQTAQTVAQLPEGTQHLAF